MRARDADSRYKAAWTSEKLIEEPDWGMVSEIRVQPEPSRAKANILPFVPLNAYEQTRRSSHGSKRRNKPSQQIFEL